jgi:1,4-alpha-glucan branching enzyme
MSAKKAKKVSEKIKETFILSAPDAGSVKLAGDFTDWEAAARTMRKLKNGNWKTTVSPAPSDYEYRFMVDGEWVDDPACEQSRPNGFGSENCVRLVKS